MKINSKRNIVRSRQRRKLFYNLITIALVILTLTNIIRDDFKLINIKKILTTEKNHIGQINDDFIISNEIYNDLESNNNIYEENLGNANYTSLNEDKNADDAKLVQEMLDTCNYNREDGKKVVYLTFDDGPSEYVTQKVLDILKDNNVKATFFVLGSMVEKSENAKLTLKRLADEGHAIANHGYCHKYDILYPNGVVDADKFIEDMNKSENILKSVLGDSFSTRVIRFPGGHNSWNTEAIDKILEEKGYVYIDWNTLNGDAEGRNLSSDTLVNRFKSTVADIYGNDDTLVVLMHDTDEKETTAQALTGIIDYLKSLGYEFRTLK